jgi:transaldolase
VVQRGAHLATVPYNVLDQLLKQSLTDVGLQRFLADWSQLQEAVSAPVR